MLPYFLHYMRGLGEYNSSDAVFKLYTGASVYCRTGTDPDSVVGIPKVRAIWGDEAGKFTLYFWENIQARADAVGARVLLTTSPYSLNWLYKDILKPYKNGKRPDVKVIEAASWENPYHSLHDPVKREKRRSEMDPRRFDMIFGGQFGRMQGLVYDCWDDFENIVDAFQLPVGTQYFGGIDWGFTDPFVFKVRAITPDGMHYGISEFYKTGLIEDDMVKAVLQKCQTFPIKTIFCDPSQPGHIEALNRAFGRFKISSSAVGAENDIRSGIDAHYNLIRQRRYKEFRDACPLSIDERENYHYPEPEDLGPDDDRKEQLPVDQYNHTMDVDRYLTAGTKHVVKDKMPRLPESTDPFHAIFNKKNKTRNTENWT